MTQMQTHTLGKQSILVLLGLVVVVMIIIVITRKPSNGRILGERFQCAGLTGSLVRGKREQVVGLAGFLLAEGPGPTLYFLELVNLCMANVKLLTHIMILCSIVDNHN